jgi:hypothetical protein
VELVAIKLVRMLNYKYRNYGPSLHASNQVMKRGFDQILWLYENEVI